MSGELDGTGVIGALTLMGVLWHLLIFLYQLIYTKMIHVPTYSKKMSLFLLLQSKIWLL